MSAKKMIFILFLNIFLLNIFVIAQNSDNELTTIKKIFDSIVSIQDDQKILTLENQIDSIFNVYLNDPKIFEKDLSILNDYCVTISSADKKIKLITWYAFYPISYSYKYHGYILFKPHKNKFQFYNLIDKSNEISDVEYKQLNKDNWYGCIYYDIINYSKSGNNSYILLGWDGNDFLTNKKIIEAIEVKEDNILFGNDFDIESKKTKRVIFEYSKSAGMLLRWHTTMNMIIWDHLSPSSQKYKGIYQYYGPDFTYDGLEFRKGIWQWKSNIVVLPDKKK